jgi:WXG100 protein secretion system (Wss), protein YukD
MVRLAQVTTGLVRITVTSATRSVDLCVPSGVAVAELVPDLVRALRLDHPTASDGYRVLARDGRLLEHDVGLAAQGIGHGAVIVISTAASDPPPAQHDDPAEAILAAVEAVAPWRDDRRGQAFSVVAAVLLLMGAAVLATEQEAGRASPVGGVVAVVLVVVAGACSRARRETALAVTLANLACGYAAVAASHWTLAGPRHSVLTAVGTGLLMAGVVAVVAMRQGSIQMLPVIVVGTAFLTAGLLTSLTGLDGPVFLTALLTVVLLASGEAPRLALGTTGAGRHAMRGPAGLDTARLAEDVARARRAMVSISVTVGVLLAVSAPGAVTLGPAGFSVPLLGSAIVTLRARRYRAAVDVLTAVGSGVAGLICTAVSVLVLDQWPRAAVGTAVALLGIAILVGALRPAVDSVRWVRTADVVERAALGALLPMALLSVGLSVAQR